MEMKNIDGKSQEVIYVPSGNIDNTKHVELMADPEGERKGSFFLYLSAFTACLVLFSATMDMVWTSPVIPRLRLADPTVNPLGRPVTPYELSLIAGLPALFLVLGAPLFAHLPNRVGRRRAIMCMAVGMLFSDAALALGSHVGVYYVARSVFALFRGAASVFVPVYLSEIAHDHNRAKLGCLMGLVNPAGNLCGYLLGPLFSVRHFTLLCVAPLVPSLLLFATIVPESPVHLAAAGDRQVALRALRRLRGRRDVDAEFRAIEGALKGRTEVERSGFASMFRSRAVRKGLLLAVGLKLAQNMAGIAVIMPFLGPMFNDAGTPLSGDSVAVLVGVVKIATFLATSFSVESVGRRPLLLFSCVGSGMPLLLLGLYFSWKGAGYGFVEDIRWLPIACILVYIVDFSVGLGPIPIALVSQLFPSDVSSVAISFTMTIMAVVVFLMTSAYPIVVEMLGVQYFIWLFSFCCFLSSGFVYFMVPETRGKSILEIQELLEKQ